MNSRYRSFKLRFFSSDVINLRDVPLSYDKLTVSIIQSTISRNLHFCTPYTFPINFKNFTSQ